MTPSGSSVRHPPASAQLEEVGAAANTIYVVTGEVGPGDEEYLLQLHVYYRPAGRLEELVTRTRASLGVNAVGELKVSWKPQFDVRDVDTNELVAKVAGNGILEPIAAACVKYLGLTAREVRRAVAGTV